MTDGAPDVLGVADDGRPRWRLDHGSGTSPQQPLGQRVVQGHSFASLVSHELRTPLTAIKALAEMLFRQHEESRPLRTEFLPLLAQEADRLALMLDALEVLERVERGELSWEWTEVSPAVIATEAMEALHGRLAGQGIEPELVGDLEPAPIGGDRARLVQAACSCIELTARWCRSPAEMLIWIVQTGQGDGRRVDLTVIAGPPEALTPVRHVAASGHTAATVSWAEAPSALAEVTLLSMVAEVICAAHGGFLQPVGLGPAGGFWAQLKSRSVTPAPFRLRWLNG